MEWLHTIWNAWQISSLPLEFIGLSLAYIEIKHPAQAHKLETFIDRLETQTNDTGHRIIGTYNFKELFTTFFILSTVGLLGEWFGLYKELHLHGLLDVLLHILLVFCYLVSITYMLIVGFFAFAEFLHFLNKFSNGKAIGSLGICIAVLQAMQNLLQNLQ